MNQAAHYGSTHIRRCCTAVLDKNPSDVVEVREALTCIVNGNRSSPRRRRPDRVSHQKSATRKEVVDLKCGDPGGDRLNPQRSGQDRRHGGHATGERVATHPM